MIFPQVFITNYSSVGSLNYADIYITLVDEFGNPVNGGNGGNGVASYYYQQNGVTIGGVRTVAMPGSSVLVYSGLISDNDNPDVTYGIYIQGFDPTPVTPPGFCDAAISSVTINQQESSPGADDAIITINASSTYLPIQYSINGTDWQSSPIFTGLTAGSFTAYIEDPQGCTATYPFSVTEGSGLLVSTPAYTVAGGNVSRWNAAFCPVVFTYQRKDFGINSIIENSGKIQVEINVFLGTNVSVGDYVYINATGYNGAGAILSIIDTNTVVLDIPYVADQTDGYANINVLRKNYRVLTRITYISKITGNQETIISTNTPNKTGLVKADLSTFLQTILRTVDESDYTQINFRDDNLSASYTVEYSAVWDGQGIAYTAIADPFYVTFTGSKLGQQQGRNMNQFVPFPSVPAESLLAEWVTDFERPTYNNGFPFDIGFIYSENIAGLQIKYKLTTLDINGNAIAVVADGFLLNEDSSFIVNLDASKYIIAKDSILGGDIVEHVGLNRLLIYQDFDPDVFSLQLYLYYEDGPDEVRITQYKYIDIGKECVEPMYMRWIGLNGSWEYWKFTWNQQVQLDVQNATIVKEFVSDWVNQVNIEKVISKQASEKVVLYAASLPIEKIQGIQAMKYSPEVQLLVNANPIKWQTMVLNTATFNEYETRYKAYDLSVTFNKPSINIQSQ